MSGLVLDLGERCTWCGNDTGPGTLRYVNRIPSLADADREWLTLEERTTYDYIDGYLCAECLNDEAEERWKVVRPACRGCDKTDMDEYACPDDSGYCLDCCACPDHREEDHLGSWRD